MSPFLVPIAIMLTQLAKRKGKLSQFSLSLTSLSNNIKKGEIQST